MKSKKDFFFFTQIPSYTRARVFTRRIVLKSLANAVGNPDVSYYECPCDVLINFIGTRVFDFNDQFFFLFTSLKYK